VRRATPRPEAKIEADLRRSIERGELLAGDRLPGARALALHYGVPLAAANEARRALERLGLVVTVPRVGAVVTSRGLPPPVSAPAEARKPSALRRSDMLRAAIRVAEVQGLAAVSMRSVALAMGVPVMALYRLARTREELVLAMMAAVFAERPLPEPAPSGVRARLELVLRAEWDVYRRHPWLGRALVGDARLFGHSEWLQRALRDHALDASTLLQVELTLSSFVRGFALRLDAADVEAGFAFGMARLIDGLVAFLETQS